MTTTQTEKGAATDCAKRSRKTYCVSPEYGTGLYRIINTTTDRANPEAEHILAESMAFSVAKEICAIFNAKA